MNFVRKWLFRLFLLVVAIVALLLAADNSTEVPLTFLEWQTPSAPVSWWMLGAFVAGTLFGMMTNVWANTRLRLASRQANKALAQSNQELDKARSETVDAG